MCLALANALLGNSPARSIPIRGVFQSAGGGLGDPVPKGGAYRVGKPYTVAADLCAGRGRQTTARRAWRPGTAMISTAADRQWRVFDMESLSAAHPTLPMPSYARVTNLSNSKSLIVRVNDRGPLSRQAA